MNSKVFPIFKRKKYDIKQILIVSINTGRLLISKRDDSKWGMWKSMDEVGYEGPIKGISKSKNKNTIGRYTFLNILAVVPEEFVPQLNGPTGYKWAMLDSISRLDLEPNLKLYLKQASKSLKRYYKEFLTENS